MYSFLICLHISLSSPVLGYIFIDGDVFRKYKAKANIMEDILRQTEEEKQLQKEEVKPIENIIKSKILGILLLIFTAYWTFLGIYDFTTFGLNLIIILTPLYVFSFIIAITLIMINKRGIYHKLIVICGIILLAFYVFALVGIVLLTEWA